MPDEFDTMDPSLAQSDDGHLVAFGNGTKYGVETHHPNQQQSDPVPIIGDYSEEYFTNGNVQMYNQREYLK